MTEHLPPGFVALGELGSGGYGTVTLARQLSLDRLVAVKTILGGTHAGADATARFRREARALARLQHPAVVRVYDLIAEHDDLFLVMEHVDGRSLRDLLDTGGPGYPARLAVLADVAAALQAAAACGVVHRDVKPSNVLVRGDGAAKLADFGLARLQADTAAFRTVAGVVSGTPTYMSPEQAAGEDELDARSDAYSFGVLAFQVLVGALPFEASDVPSMLSAHRSRPPFAPSALLPGFPGAADAVLLAALAKDPARRALPGEVMAALQAVPGRAWPAPPPATAPATSVAVQPTATDAVAVIAPPRPVDEVRRPAATAPAAPETRVEPPVYDPGPTGRRRPRRTGLLVTGLGAVVAALLAGMLLQRGGGDDVRVTAVTVTVAPQLGRCPAATYLFTAVLHTNGQAGQVQLRWLRPDGTTAPLQRVGARQRQTEVRAQLQFQVSGATSFGGAAVAQLPADHRQAAAQIRYVCP